MLPDLGICPRRFVGTLGSPNPEEVPDMLKRILAGATSLLLALGMVALATAPAQAAGPQYNGDKVTICHSPSSASNPWTVNTVSVNSMKEDGHIDPSLSDTHADDIIPPFWYDVHVDGPDWEGVFYPGKNLDTLFSGFTGAEILANGCALPQNLAITGAGTPETCTAGAVVAGSILLTVLVNGSSVALPVNGVTVTVTGPGYTDAVVTSTSLTGLADGDYTFTVTTDASKKLSTPAVFVVNVADSGACGEQPTTVTPDFDVADQVCEVPEEAEAGVLVDGYITVDLSVPGVTYAISKGGSPVPFDAVTGMTGPLAPGDYLVEATDADGTDMYVLAAPFSETATIAADDSVLCEQLVDHPLVVPNVTYQEATCTVPTGSYTLSNNQTLPADPTQAVFWTVDGSPVAEGTHSAAAGSTVHIVATANGPDYGFEGEAPTLAFDHDFADAPTDCDLTTLALTGQDSSSLLGMAGFLGLLGVALLRTARRRNRFGMAD